MIIDRKYASERFGVMAPEKIRLHSQALVLKIHAITGWTLPEETIANILIDQLSKVLTEKYSTLNADEFEYAIRNHGTTIKDWGKSMNLSLIDEALSEYMAARREVSWIEGNKPKELPTPKFNPNMAEEWEALKKIVKKGNFSFEFIGIHFYEWRNHSNPIPVEIKKKYFEEAKQMRLAKLIGVNERYRTKETGKALADFTEMKAAGKFSEEENNRLQIIAKKMIVFDIMLKEEVK